MKIQYTCSNCGKHFQTSAMCGVPEGMYLLGCRAVGDAFYCEDCVKTWADRNGKPFDEQYAMPVKMFTKWWNNMVDEQARHESKRGICWNCRHLRKFNGDLADWVCERKCSVVIDTRRRECDDMWEERE